MTQLRTGITTGTCAAAAAHAAACMLCGLPVPEEVVVALPRGGQLEVPIRRAESTPDGAVAAVCKDAGDDPDVTDGMDVVVEVAWSAVEESTFHAGDGVGTVTKPGLQIPPGQPAINPVPRRMILEAIREVTDRPVRVTVSIPGGCEVAQATFNPRLGIVDGLSVLGTTGIVQPYCARAMKAAIRTALDVASACEVAAPVLVPGNIGASAATSLFSLSEEQVIEAGNLWGFVLDEVARRSFPAVMLVGHPGKLAKLIRGDWDTHSSRSGRAVDLVTEIAAGVVSSSFEPTETVEGIFAALSSDDGQRLGEELASRIEDAVVQRIGAEPAVSVVLVDMAGNRLGSSGDLMPWQ